MTDDRSSEFTIVAQFPDVLSAQAALSFLHGAGLNAHLWDEASVRMTGLLTIALGGVKLVVPWDEAEDAASLLEGMGVPVDPEFTNQDE